MKSSRETGLSLVELMIVIAISAPMMFAVLSTTERVGHTVSTVSRSADVTSEVRQVADRISRLVRASHRSTFQVSATQADVIAGRATAVGEWIAALDADPRGDTRFRSAAGDLSMNAAALTTPRELVFELDPAESANGIDDDGDGLVDEGALVLRYGDTRGPLLRGVESCQFELDGRALRWTLRSGRSDGQGNTSRVTAQYVWWIRNP